MSSDVDKVICLMMNQSWVLLKTIARSIGIIFEIMIFPDGNASLKRVPKPLGLTPPQTGLPKTLGSGFIRLRRKPRASPVDECVNRALTAVG